MLHQADTAVGCTQTGIEKFYTLYNYESGPVFNSQDRLVLLMIRRQVSFKLHSLTIHLYLLARGDQEIFFTVDGSGLYQIALIRVDGHGGLSGLDLKFSGVNQVGRSEDRVLTKLLSAAFFERADPLLRYAAILKDGADVPRSYSQRLRRFALLVLGDLICQKPEA